LKQAEIKLAMNLFLKDNAEYTSYHYAIGFFAKEKGIYSGVVNNDGKVYGFVIDFAKRDFFIEGVTGKHLVENHSNLSKIFPKNELKSGKDSSETLNKFYKMGIVLGDYSPYGYFEAEDIGRGIFRTIKTYPVLEKMVSLPWVASSDYSTIKILKDLNYAKEKDEGKSSLRALTGLSKKHFKLFSEADSSETAYSILEAGEDWLELLDRVLAVSKQVDKERGYHDAKRYKNLFAKPGRYTHYREQCTNLFKGLDKLATKNTIRYLYFSCYHQQALDPEEAINVLRDYWNLIKDSRGVTKYPRYLKTAHDVASKNFSVIKDMASNMGVYNNYMKHKNLEMVLGDTAFIVGAVPQEIADEANQQSNCVAGYINSVASGDTLIMFMRDACDINNSDVTFEIKNGKLVQAYATYDRRLNSEQSKKLLGFCKHMNIEVIPQLALDYSVTPSRYNSQKPLEKFHDEKLIGGLKKKYLEKVSEINSDLVNNKSMVKSA